MTTKKSIIFHSKLSIIDSFHRKFAQTACSLGFNHKNRANVQVEWTLHMCRQTMNFPFIFNPGIESREKQNEQN